VPAYVTEGIHPRVIAMSNSLGNVFHGRRDRSGLQHQFDPADSSGTVARHAELVRHDLHDQAHSGLKHVTA
jgi:hypothetical protein